MDGENNLLNLNAPNSVAIVTNFTKLFCFIKRAFIAFTLHSYKCVTSDDI